MSAHETFARDILVKELETRRFEFVRLSDEACTLRNEMMISTSKALYSTLKSDIDQIDKRRRELRGEMSALRQAIAKLEKDE